MSAANRLLALLLLVLLSSCGAGDDSGRDGSESDAGVLVWAPEIISAHTDGVISRTKPVQLRFVDPIVSDAELHQDVVSPFTFSPRLQGSAQWSSPHELVFLPGDHLVPGQSYKVGVDLGKVQDEWAGKKLAFDFAAMHQTYWVDHMGMEAETGTTFTVTGTSTDSKSPWLSLRREARVESRELAQLPDGTPLYRRSSSGDWADVEVLSGESRGSRGFVHSTFIESSKRSLVQKFVGVLRTADVADSGRLEKVLEASQDDTPREISWQHDPVSREHRFVVTGLVRQEQPSELLLALDGQHIGVSRVAEERVAVPPLTAFSLSSARAVATGDRHLELRFSDPLDERQQLAGLITVSGRSDIRFSVKGSVVHVYANRPWSTEESVTVQGVRDAAGRRLARATTETVSFAPIKPAVRFAGKGVIFPTSDGVSVPIEVVNLRSVKVEVHQVFSSNVPQFLQVNHLDDNSELNRVGRPVWRKRLDIERPDQSSNRWVHLALDVAPLLKNHPNGLYRIKLSFGYDDILYECANARPPGAVEEEALEADWESFGEEEQSNWDWWGGSVDYWEMWQNRDNPCHPGYYGDDQPNARASRNIMVSNLGLMAKQGEDGRVLAIVTDLRSAEPIVGAQVRLLDYQLQEMTAATSAAGGLIALRTERKPFILEAHHDGQAAYLRLDRGNALSVGHFDVSGSSVTEGIKGFLYAERGVWRPGDDIHLQFVVLDQTGRLPANHPVHLKLTDPRGQVVERRTVTEGMDGFYDLQTGTSIDSPTGNYTAEVKVGGAVFRRVLRVETVVPNRLKIDLDFGTKMLKGARPQLRSTLAARWLHGAIARNLESSIEVTLTGRKTTFPRHENYIFNDPTTSVETETREIFRGRLDETGQTPVIAPIEVPANTPGMLTALFRTRVFEPGGSASTDQASIPLSPHDRYIGIKTPKGDAARGMLLTDVQHEVEVVAVDADGRTVGDGEVELKLYKVGWRWWWEKGAETFADYAGSNDHSTVAQGTVQLRDGKGTWTFEVKEPEWGRYLLVAQDRSGTRHRTGKVLYIDWPNWAGRGQKDNPGGASVLTFSADENKVEIGQTATLSIPTPPGSRALVSLENGSGVLQTAWVTPQGQETLWSFRTTAAMSPNVYAHVTLVQPHSNSANDAPVRLYGVVPIEVFDPETRLQPELHTAEVFEPESKTTIEVKEQQGREMTYTVAVVDEGLLGLTRFKTPDPWALFYAREALGVRTWDSFDMVAGAYGGAIEGLLAVGGGGADDAPPVAKANRFPPMVRVIGPFRLAAGDTGRHEIDIPRYLGEVRVMVVAGRDGAFGNTERSVKVKKPLMVLATLPRVVSVEEEVALPVSVFVIEEGLKKVKLKVEVSGPLEVVGGNSQNLQFSAPGDKLVALKLRVGAVPGVGTVTVSARSGKEKVSQSIEIDIRHPGARLTRVHGGVAQAGQPWKQDIRLVGMAGSHEALLEVSRVPPLDLGKHLPGLIRYPHGCLEQTTSSAFPQLYLTKLIELSPERQDTVRHNLLSAIDRLRAFQNYSGGFGYWPGSGKPDSWATSYAGHFLIEAERSGYALPPGMRSKWISYQAQAANRWNQGDNGSILDQAYRLYTLALAGSPELGAMNRLQVSRLPLAARWRLAAAYQLAGQREAAGELVAGLGTDVAAYQEPGGTFGSALRDEAMILETLVLLGRNEEAMSQARKVSAAITAQQWLSTQTTAYALVAMARFAAPDNDGAVTAFQWKGPDGRWQKVSSQRPVVQVPIELAESVSAFTAEVKNTGDGILSTRVILHGIAPLGSERTRGNRIAMKVVYETAGEQAIDPRKITQGTDFKALITVTNPGTGRLQQLALSHLLPSGWESHGEAPGKGKGFSYRDVRDDRVDTYFDLEPGESRLFELQLHASYLGHFYLPAVQVEAMYDSTLFAREAGHWVDVLPITPES